MHLPVRRRFDSLFVSETGRPARLRRMPAAVVVIVAVAVAIVLIMKRKKAKRLEAEEEELFDEVERSAEDER